MRIKGAIFDMDGLLVDSERMMLAVNRLYSARTGIDFEALMPQLTGSNSADAERICKSHFGQDFDYCAMRRERLALADAYMAENGLRVMPGVRRLLACMRELGINWIVASSSDRALVDKRLLAAGIAADFPLAVTGDMVQRGKPDPEIFLLAAETLGTGPGETAVFEDSYNGVYAGINGGFVTCMVPDLYPATDGIRESGVQVFGSLLDAIAFIRGEHPPKTVD